MSMQLYEEAMDLAAGLHLTGDIDAHTYEMISDIEKDDTEKLGRVVEILKRMGGTNNG